MHRPPNNTSANTPGHNLQYTLYNTPEYNKPSIIHLCTIHLYFYVPVHLYTIHQYNSILYTVNQYTITLLHQYTSHQFTYRPVSLTNSRLYTSTSTRTELEKSRSLQSRIRGRSGSLGNIFTKKLPNFVKFWDMP